MNPVLHAPKGRNRFCGPTALSAITGLSRDTIAELARHVGGRRVIKGMFNSEALGVLELLGAKTTGILGKDSSRRKQTLERWMYDRPESQRDVLTLVNVTNHYVAVLGNTVLCSLQQGEKRHILSAACAKRHVVRAWKIELPEKIKVPAEIAEVRAHKAEQRRRVKRITSKAYGAAKVLASELGLRVEKYEHGDYGIFVDNPRWHIAMLAEGLITEGEDPEEAIGDQCRTSGRDWDDVLSCLQDIKNAFPTMHQPLTTRIIG